MGKKRRSKVAGVPTERRRLSELIPASYNPRKISDEAKLALRRSIEEFGLVQPIVWNRRTGRVVGGHQRLSILAEMGVREVEVAEVDLDDSHEKALNIALNSERLQGEWDLPALREVLGGLEAEGLGGLLKDLDVEGLLSDMVREYESDPRCLLDKPKSAGSAPAYPEPDADASEVVRECDRMVVEFSGGKDSTVALGWARAVSERTGRPLTALFVETGAEFPDLTLHVARVCREMGVDLKMLHPERNIVAHYYGVGKWPSPIYRDCQSRFINDVVDRYCRQQFGEEIVATIRGGRKDQKTSRTRGIACKRVSGKGPVKWLISPMYGQDSESYAAELKRVERHLWRGYNLGFVRTACWMCPFQLTEQWEAMKKHYPLLWRGMLHLSKTLEFQVARGDRYWPRFRNYWRRASE